MAAIRERQQARGFRPATWEDVEAYLQAERASGGTEPRTGREGLTESATFYIVRNTTAPHVLDRLLTPVSRCLTPEVARALVALRVDADTQARLDELAERCTEGRLSAEERQEYAAYVSTIDFIATLQSKARALLAGKPDAA